MQKIMEFNGSKTVEMVEQQDYAAVINLLPKGYREITITTQEDFNQAVQAGCRIYMQSSSERGERLFIRVPKEELFKVAEKC